MRLFLPWMMPGVSGGQQSRIRQGKEPYLDTIQLRLYTSFKITTVMKGGIYESEA